MPSSLISSYLFMSLSQCQSLKFTFTGYFPPFDVRAKVFNTSLGFFLHQALTCRSPSDIKDGSNMIKDHHLSDIEVVFHHVNNISRVPPQFEKSPVSFLGSLINCNQQTISSPSIHSVVIPEWAPDHLVYLLLMRVKMSLVQNFSIRCHL